MNHFLPLEANITETVGVVLKWARVSTKLLHPFEALAGSHSLVEVIGTKRIECRDVRIDFILNVF